MSRVMGPCPASWGRAPARVSQECVYAVAWQEGTVPLETEGAFGPRGA